MRHTVRGSRHPATALLLLALLSAVLLGGVQGASCAMHGLGAAGSDAVHAVHAVHATAHHRAHAPGVGPESGQHSHGAGTPGCDCTCIGACTMVAPLPKAPAAATLHVALVEPKPRVPLDREPAHPPQVESDRLLPFGNGPPASPLA